MESECGKQRHGGEGKRKNNQTFSEKTKENLSKIKRQCSRPRAYRLATSGRFLVGLRKNATCCLAGSIGEGHQYRSQSEIVALWEKFRDYLLDIETLLRLKLKQHTYTCYVM
ncbi:uncharacterized protein LOC128197955 [Vigna angularis]|uniref:uncharacterized protein LOC128197955 n=1 Tax=Phaseolus angularis TaxID=3914 RepID=UPI0022B40469|nr:uncharacterized protein LOC128197955 [Vigna angularis]